MDHFLKQLTARFSGPRCGQHAATPSCDPCKHYAAATNTFGPIQCVLPSQKTKNDSFFCVGGFARYFSVMLGKSRWFPGSRCDPNATTSPCDPFNTIARPKIRKTAVSCEPNIHKYCFVDVLPVTFDHLMHCTVPKCPPRLRTATESRPCRQMYYTNATSHCAKPNTRKQARVERQFRVPDRFPPIDHHMRFGQRFPGSRCGQNATVRSFDGCDRHKNTYTCRLADPKTGETTDSSTLTPALPLLTPLFEQQHR